MIKGSIETLYQIIHLRKEIPITIPVETEEEVIKEFESKIEEGFRVDNIAIASFKHRRKFYLRWKTNRTYWVVSNIKAERRKY